MSSTAIARRRTAQTRIQRVKAAAAARKVVQGDLLDGSSDLRAKFDAAQTTDDNYKHWSNADSLGPNAALNPLVRRLTRNRARYEFNNDSYAHGIVLTRAMDVVGTGPTLQCTTGFGPKVDEKIESRFWDWMLATRTPDKLLTCEITKTIGGEWFASFFNNPKLADPTSLDYQPHEPEMISNPRLGFDSDRLDGIILDDWGNTLAYLLLREHPGEGLYPGLSAIADPIPARDMLHVFACHRPGQIRGISEVVSALPLFAKRRRYANAVLSAAEIAACLSWLLKTQLNAAEIEHVKPMDAIEFYSGMGMALPAGYDVEQLQAQQPTTQYGDYTRCLIAEIARCLCMPFNIAAGDSAGYNYSSARLDHRIYMKSIRLERFQIETQVLDRLFARWWEFAHLVSGYLPRAVRFRAQPPSHDWRWDGEEYIDPQKEANAAETRVTTGTSNRIREMIIAGLDPNAEDAKAAAGYGITIEEYRQRLLDAHFPKQPTPAAPSAKPLVPDDIDDEDEEDDED